MYAARTRVGLFALVLFASIAAALVFASDERAAAETTVEIQILNVSDWHGQIDPISDASLGAVGGAAIITAYWEKDREANPNTLTLTAGDAFGATPPLSNLFGDDPAVFAMNLMGIQVDTLGNHNFDRGIAHLQRMINLANFQYVSANLANVDANLNGVKPFEIFDIAGVKVAVVGLTNPEAPTLVFPGSFGTIQITDPVIAARIAREEAEKEGAEVFLLITHMGVTGKDPVTGADTGPLIDLAEQVDGYDVIFGDHTDVRFSTTINGTLVHENRSKGLSYAKTALTFDVDTRRVVDKSVEFVTPFVAGTEPDPRFEAKFATYRKELSDKLTVQTGEATGPLLRSDNCGRPDGRFCESAIGNAITDAMRRTYSADFAVTNSGGIRADLTCPATDSPTDFCPSFTAPPYPITQGQVTTVLPFGNSAVTVSVTGADLKAILENGVSRMPAADGRFPQVSGFCFAYDVSASAGNRVTAAVRQAADGCCSGLAVDLTANTNYTVVMNDFMVAGGDGYPVLTTRSVSREPLDAVVRDFLAANSPAQPVLQGRIVCQTNSSVACPTQNTATPSTFGGGGTTVSTGSSGATGGGTTSVTPPSTGDGGIVPTDSRSSMRLAVFATLATIGVAIVASFWSGKPRAISHR